jgi:hypothetical protein
MDKNGNDTTKQAPEHDITHIKRFDDNAGKQGVVGIVEIDGCQYIYKISQYMNHLTNHESLVMNGLTELLEFCPHFCRIFKTQTCAIHPKFRNPSQNPFEPSDRPVQLDVLFMEYVEGSNDLLSLIENPEIPVTHIISCIKQVLVSIIIAQREKRFVHYDLHSMNVLIKPCDKDDVYLYILDKENVVSIPTYGYHAVIIDYGFSYSDDMNNNPSYLSLAYTNAGYMSPGYDPIADTKIFLVSLSDDFKSSRKEADAKRFRNISKNIFKKLHIDWRSGWDKYDSSPILDQLLKYIESVDESSLLFKHYSHLCLDMLQSLITLPFQPSVTGTLKELRRSYKIFVHEFTKIETEISNSFYSLYIFRQMIDTVRGLRGKYMDVHSRINTVRFFKNEMFNQIDSVVKFCTLKTVNFEKLLCSLFVFQEQLEYQLYHMLNRHMKQKFKEYSRMEVQNIEHMYGIIDINFQDDYVFTDKTIVHVWDAVDKMSEEIDAVELVCLEEINEMEPVFRGLYMYSKLLEGAVEESVSDETVPEDTVPEDTVPEDTVPDEDKTI